MRPDGRSIDDLADDDDNWLIALRDREQEHMQTETFDAIIVGAGQAGGEESRARSLPTKAHRIEAIWRVPGTKARVLVSAA